MARIYFKLPQCISFQEKPTRRQMVTLTCAALIIIIIVILFIHSYILDDQENTSPSHHFLPTAIHSDINSAHSYFSYGPSVHYGIVLDCGSSGTRVYVYIWPPHSGNPQDLLSIQQLKDQYNQPVVMKVSPGLDTYESHPDDASDYLYPLLKFAASHIPRNQHKETLLYILATAGMRLLSEESQQNILQDLQRDIPKKFDFVIAESNFEVISGKQEGVYAWIAANYALQKFGHGDEDRYDHPLVAVDIPGENGGVTQHVRRRTVGMIDMGGGSMQIAYEITNNADSIPKHLMAEFNLGCQSFDVEHTYRVYVTTFLGYGANEARSRYEEHLISKTANAQVSHSSRSGRRRKRNVISDEKLAINLNPNMNSDDEVKLAAENINKSHEVTAKQLLQKSLVGNIPPPPEVTLPRAVAIPPRAAATQVPPITIKSRYIPAPAPAYNSFHVIRDPCLPDGLTLEPREPEFEGKVNFTGTGNYLTCEESLTPLLNLTVPCKLPPCSMNGVHQPPISYHNSQFYGFSELWYTMEDVFRIGGLYEHDIFETHAKDFCEKKWSVLMSQFNKKLYPKADIERFRMECFKSAWMTAVLHKGLQLPENYKGLQSVQFINNRDVQWTLGALIHRTRYLPLREIQEHQERTKYKPSWLNTSHIFYNEYLLVLCFIIVVMAIFIYIRRLKLCSSKVARDMSRVPSMSYFMTEMDQVEQGVRLMSDYTYPDR